MMTLKYSWKNNKQQKNSFKVYSQSNKRVFKIWNKLLSKVSKEMIDFDKRCH